MSLFKFEKQKPLRFLMLVIMLFANGVMAEDLNSANTIRSRIDDYFTQAMAKNENGSFLFFGFEDGGKEGRNRSCDAIVFKDRDGEPIFHIPGSRYNYTWWGPYETPSQREFPTHLPYYLPPVGSRADLWGYEIQESRYMVRGYVQVAFDASNRIGDISNVAYEAGNYSGSSGPCYVGDRAHQISTQIVVIDKNNKRSSDPNSNSRRHLNDAHLYLEDSLLSPDVISVDYIVKSYIASGKKLMLKKELHLNSKDLKSVSADYNSPDHGSPYRFVKKLTKKELGLSFNNRNVVITISGTKKLRNIDGTERYLGFSIPAIKIKSLNETLVYGLDTNRTYPAIWEDSN